MAKIIGVQESFTAGEGSFRIKGRSTVDKYAAALDTATNATIVSQGPIIRRNGSTFIAEVKDSTKKVRLIPFVVSVSQSFILEFGDLYVRFYTQGSQVAGPFEIASPWDEDEIFDLQYAQFGAKMYITHPLHGPRELIFNSTTDWDIRLFVPVPPPTFEEGFFPNETVTPAATTGLDISFTASSATFLDGDIGREIVNLTSGETGRGSIISLVSTSEAKVDITEDFTDTNAIAAGDWKMGGSPIQEITPDGTKVGASVTLTATTDATFRNGNVGDYILIHGGVGRIIQVPTTLKAKMTVLKALNSKDATEAWTIQQEAWTALRGFPKTVTLAQQRLWFASTDAEPQTIWMSESGILDSFGVGPEDDDSLNITLVSPDFSSIEWIAAGRDVIIGTSGGEATMSTNNQVITPSNRSATFRTKYRSKGQTPLRIGGEIVFVQGGERKVRTYFFDFGTDSWKGEDLTFIAEHITEGGIVDTAYAQEPNLQILAVRGTGDMAVATYDRIQGTIGWTNWTTDGDYESVATIVRSQVDEVWAVVRRDVDGVSKRYIELTDSFEDGTDDLHIFSDSSLTFSVPLTITGITQASPAVVTSASHGLVAGDLVRLKDIKGMTELNGGKFTVANETTNTFELVDTDSSAFTAYLSDGEAFKMVTTLTGLDHLEGKSVEIKIDGAVHPLKTVSSGSVTLDFATGEATIGLPYTTTIITLPREMNIGRGTMQGQRKRWVKPILRVDTSSRPIVNGDIKPSREPAFLMDQAVPLVSGDLTYGGTQWGSDAVLTIVASDPLPFRLLAIYGTVEGDIL